jgi:hypothetical protein
MPLWLTLMVFLWKAKLWQLKGPNERDQELPPQGNTSVHQSLEEGHHLDMMTAIEESTLDHDTMTDMTITTEDHDTTTEIECIGNEGIHLDTMTEHNQHHREDLIVTEREIIVTIETTETMADIEEMTGIETMVDRVRHLAVGEIVVRLLRGIIETNSLHTEETTDMEIGKEMIIVRKVF